MTSVAEPTRRTAGHAGGKSIRWGKGEPIVVDIDGVPSHFLGQASFGRDHSGQALVLTEGNAAQVAEALLLEMGVHRRDVGKVKDDVTRLFNDLADGEGHPSMALEPMALHIQQIVQLEQSRSGDSLSLDIGR